MELRLPRPDDWHVHFRDGAVRDAVVPHTARHFARALVMPNLVPPVVRGAEAAAYRDRILAASPEGFTPLMTLYLTETTCPDDVAAAAEAGVIAAVKLYPAGATTNSASGVRNIDAVMPVLERMAEIGLPLCVHGEVTDPEIDIFDREAVFIERVLAPLAARLPELRIVMEHITTADGIGFARETSQVAGTLTVQHLMLDRNALLVGGIRPHYYCLPVLKRAQHRKALRAAAVSGDPTFFLGTDSAPHTDPNKLSDCGCAGCFTAPVALACLAHVFEEEGALDRLAGFTSEHGARFYGRAVSKEQITLRKETQPVAPPAQITSAEGPITVFDPGHPLFWRVL